MTSSRAESRTEQFGGTTIGYGLIGLSAFAFLALGPRLLGPDGYSVAAVAWTLSMVLGLGLAVPGEQTITRITAAGGSLHAARQVLRRLGFATGLSLLVPIASMLGFPMFGLTGWWAWAVPVAVLGWTLAAVERGRLAGRSQFRPYSAALLAESTARVLLCALAWLLPAFAVPLLAAAIGIPLVASALAGRSLSHPETTPPADLPTLSSAREHSEVTVVALLIQITIGTAPLWLQFNQGGGAVAGIAVTALSYFRIPLIAVGGVSAVTLSTVSAAFGRGDRAGAIREINRASGIVAVAAAGMLVVLGTLSEPLLHLFYGQNLALPWQTVVLFCLGSWSVVLASLLTPVTFAVRRARVALYVWLAAAVATSLGLALGADSVFSVALILALVLTPVALTLWGVCRQATRG